MFEYYQDDVSPREHAYDLGKVEVTDEDTPTTSMDLTDANIGRWPVANLLKKMVKPYDKGKNLLDESENYDENASKSSSLATVGDTLDMSFDQRKDYVREKIGRSLSPNDYSVIEKINPLRGFFRLYDIPLKVDYRKVFKTPTIDDYFISTNTRFEYVGPNQSDGMSPAEVEKENRRIWNEMKDSGKYDEIVMK